MGFSRPEDWEKHSESWRVYIQEITDFVKDYKKTKICISDDLWLQILTVPSLIAHRRLMRLLILHSQVAWI